MGAAPRRRTSGGSSRRSRRQARIHSSYWRCRSAPCTAAHWSLSGEGVPDERTTDDAVYLPGRNLLLLTPPSVWCALHDVHVIALGTLKGNPFPDATDTFFAAFSALAQRAMDSPSRSSPRSPGSSRPTSSSGVGTWRSSTRSRASIRRDGRHCGRCNKCVERRSAFRTSSIEDRTDYADR